MITLQHYVAYALPLIVLFIGAGTLLLNALIRNGKRSVSPSKAPDLEPPLRREGEVVVTYDFRANTRA